MKRMAANQLIQPAFCDVIFQLLVGGIAIDATRCLLKANGFVSENVLKEYVQPVSLLLYGFPIRVMELCAPAELVQQIVKEKILFKSWVTFEHK